MFKLPSFIRQLAYSLVAILAPLAVALFSFYLAVTTRSFGSFFLGLMMVGVAFIGWISTRGLVKKPGD